MLAFLTLLIILKHFNGRALVKLCHISSEFINITKASHSSSYNSPPTNMYTELKGLYNQNFR